MSTTSTSIWVALRNPVFCKLWLASVVSGCCVSAHDMAATWVMNTMTLSPFLPVAVVHRRFSPFLLVHISGGRSGGHGQSQETSMRDACLASRGRRRACASWGRSELLNPSIMLIAVFLLGIGFACNAPAWTSVIPDVVTKEELPSAVTLGGVQMNISGVIGPALGGLILPLIGANAVFAVNAVGFLLVLDRDRELAQSAQAIESSRRKHPRVLRRRCALRPIQPRNPGCADPRSPVLPADLGDPGPASGSGTQGAPPDLLASGHSFHQHGCRLALGRGLRRALGQSAFQFERGHDAGEPPHSGRLYLDGRHSPT